MKQFAHRGLNYKWLGRLDHDKTNCTKLTRQTGISSKQRHNPRLQFHVKWSAPDSSALFRLTFRHPLCTFEESRTACHLSWSQFSIQLWLQIETSSVPAIPCLSGTHCRDSPISLEHSIRDTDPNATGGWKKAVHMTCSACTYVSCSFQGTTPSMPGSRMTKLVSIMYDIARGWRGRFSSGSSSSRGNILWRQQGDFSAEVRLD